MVTSKGSLPQIHAGGIWALPVRGGGLDPCPDGLGHFFREEFAKIKWAFAWFWGGLNPCQDGLGHLCSENWSSIRYFLLLTRDLRLARILCGTYIPSKQWFDKVAQIGPEKSAPECPFECGGGCNCHLGNAQIEVTLTSKVLPLTWWLCWPWWSWWP